MIFFAVRLVDGIDPNEGRVEISSGDVWGTVCNDNWGIKEPHVICRMLGHEKAVKQYSFGKGANGQPIWLRDISCSGCEDSILECKRANIGKQTCDHKDDVGVVCLPKTKGIKFKCIFVCLQKGKSVICKSKDIFFVL